MPLIAFLGRQPKISLAELESKYGADNIDPIKRSAAKLNVERNSNEFKKLGGTIKIAEIIDEIDVKSLFEISKYLEQNTEKFFENHGEGKITLGISTYEVKANSKQINGLALELKKKIKKLGRPVRVVPNQNLELSSAQIVHNKLTSESGFELNIIKSDNQIILARTIWVQDIDAYVNRDRNRPKRDTKVGMLPPKLAQILINIAVGQNEIKAILDPFCGTGVLIQEAQLMGFSTIGSDIDPRMVEYTKENLNWLDLSNSNVSVLDATSSKWQKEFSSVASETFLGRPLSSLPDNQTVNKIIQDCDVIHKKFLQNIASQTKKGFRMCVAVPAWKTNQRFLHLPTLEKLSSLGYNRISFVHCEDSDLVYHRKDQIVARELLVLERT